MSYESRWLKGLNFICFFLSGSNHFQINKWNCQVSYMNCSVLKCHILFWNLREFPWLEVPSFKWISLFESTQFHINIWNSMKFIVWTCKIHWIWCNGLQIISSASKSFLDSLTQEAIIKQGANIMQPLEDAGMCICDHMCIHTYLTLHLRRSPFNNKGSESPASLGVGGLLEWVPFRFAWSWWIVVYCMILVIWSMFSYCTFTMEL